MLLENYTPHSLKMFGKDGSIVELLPSGAAPRVSRGVEVEVDRIDGLPIVRAELGDLEGLPPVEDGVLYVVSALVAVAAKAQGRTDFVSPRVVRDTQGNVIGCDGFILP